MEREPAKRAAARPDGVLQYRLYKATLGGSISRLMPASPARDEQRPTFTRDGKWLYFVEEPDLDMSWYVWRARPDGTGAERVSAAIRSTTGPLRTTFGPSPDGTRVVFSRLVCCQTTQWLLTVADVPSGKTVDLPIEAEGARWSPTGETVAYTNRTGTGVVRPDGSGDRKFAESYMGWGDLSFDWSPDGRWLITRTQGPLQLIEVATGLTIPLTYAPAAYQPSWKP